MLAAILEADAQQPPEYVTWRVLSFDTCWAMGWGVVWTHAALGNISDTIHRKQYPKAEPLHLHKLLTVYSTSMGVHVISSSILVTHTLHHVWWNRLRVWASPDVRLTTTSTSGRG